MNDKNNLRMMLREALDNMWSRIRSLFGGLDDRVTALEEGGGTPGPQGPKGDKGDKGDPGPQGPKGDPGDPATNIITSVNGKTGAVVLNAADVGAIPSTQKGVAGGVAELDSGGKVPSSQLPSYVDDVLEYASRSAFPSTGETGKIYVATDTNITYRWSGSAYVEISPSLALGETSSTAYRGDRGKAAYDHAQAKGSAFASGLYKIQTNAEGHVTGAVAVAKSDITGLGIPAQDTTYSAATTTAPGLMSATDKAKLDDANACAMVGPSAIASISDAYAADALDITIGIEPVQSGSGDPSPTNVRPISGWTGAQVTRTGKNLFDKNVGVINGYINSRGVFTSSSSGEKCVSLSLLAGTYTVSKAISSRFIVATFDAAPVTGSIGTILNTSPNITNFTFTLTESKLVVCFIYNNTGESTTFESLLNTVQVELGSTATAYEPYTGTTYPITFPSEAGTVYGGTLDVTTGLLTVDRGNIASYAGETLPGVWISSMDVYTAGGTPTTGAQVVYELATPQTYQLTPTQIALLEGVNNVWADTGETTVGYLRADSLCINRAIAARLKGGGDVNVIESISVNGTNIPPDANKNVNLTVPEDVGFYVDAQGYLCQRIRSDT